MTNITAKIRPQQFYLYPVDNTIIGFPNTCLLDSDLSIAQCYPTFEQPGPGYAFQPQNHKLINYRSSQQFSFLCAIGLFLLTQQHSRNLSGVHGFPGLTINQGQVFNPWAQLFRGQLPVALNPGLNLTWVSFFFCSKVFSWIIFCYFQGFQSSTYRQKELKLRCFLSFQI